MSRKLFGVRCSEAVSKRGGLNVLIPTPGFGVDTSRCSYCGAEAYPRTNRGRLFDLNCEATRADDLNACILCMVNRYVLGGAIGEGVNYIIAKVWSSGALVGSIGEPRLCTPPKHSRMQFATDGQLHQ